MNAFSRLPWNQQILDRLCELEQQQKLGHAYLLQGQRGLGKETLVRDFAALLLCERPEQGAECGTCKGCHLFSAGTHPDFKYIGLEESASQIKIEQIRESRSFFANTALIGKYKILLLSPAESLNLNAANAFLKNLEEPAPGTLLFLVSHQPGLLLPTIRSRCQQIKFTHPEKKLALSWLEQTISKEQAILSLALANGAPLQALVYASDERQQERRELHKRLLKLLLAEITVSEAVKKIIESSIDDVLEIFMLTVQELIRQLQSQQESLKALLSTNELQKIADHLNATDLVSLHYFYAELLRARKANLSTANPNMQLLLESLCYRWVKLVKENQTMELVKL